MRPVTRQDWKAEPLLPPRSPVPLVRRYDSLQLDRLRHGVKPRAMEEKWFVFTEGDTVFLHRSWTGLGVFEVVLRREGTGAAIEQAWVSAHPERVRDVSAVASMLDDSDCMSSAPMMASRLAAMSTSMITRTKTIAEAINAMAARQREQAP